MLIINTITIIDNELEILVDCIGVLVRDFLKKTNTQIG